MSGLDIIYADELTSYSYSYGRDAVGEWYNAPARPTIFAGWLWDGKVRDRAHAVQLVTELTGASR